MQEPNWVLLSSWRDVWYVFQIDFASLQRRAEEKTSPGKNLDIIMVLFPDALLNWGFLCTASSNSYYRFLQECLNQHEKNMELSFAIARSKEKTCGVCFEVIMEKATGEQRFGILPNCNHCFCLNCIRRWRQARQFDNKIIR